ncbi:MAG: GFA family protein [Vitreimonas sp.]
MTEEPYEGRCLCGAVRFKAESPPKWVLWCHCESCRRHSGAPASVFVSFADDAVRISGEIAKYESSPGVERGFCARCGSTLTCTNPKLPNETHFHIGAFERAAELAPTGEFFANERMPWFEPRTGPVGSVAALAGKGDTR